MPSQPAAWDALRLPTQALEEGLSHLHHVFLTSHTFSPQCLIPVNKQPSFHTGFTLAIRKKKKSTRRTKQEFGEGCGWCGVPTSLAKLCSWLLTPFWFVCMRARSIWCYQSVQTHLLPQKMQACDRNWRENCLLIPSYNSSWFYYLLQKSGLNMADSKPL